MIFPPELIERARVLLEALRSRRIMLATAESCTGGLVCGLLTEIPGSSDVVDRGYVTYSNDAKMECLGVPADLLKTCGAVSAEVACAMAEGALARSRASVAVATTGVAGPGGGTPGKPVGLVHFAVAGTGQPTAHLERRFGDIGRAPIRLESVKTAIYLIRDALKI
jgi:nicotinamide-nucleotide amidase